MKKSWLSLLLALALAMCLGCGAALAEGEGPDLQFSFSNDKGNNTVPIGIVPPEAQHIISAADWMGELNIGNFDEMTAAYPGIGDVQRNWSIELVSGPDMQAYIEYWGDVVSDAVLHFGRQPESACDIVYRVTCEWDGHTTSTEYTFHAFMLTDLPTGNTLRELYVAQPGETLTVLGDLIPENWLVPGREDDHNSFGLWEYDHTNQNPGVDYTVSEDGYNTVTFTSTNPGLYEFNGFIARGNVSGGDTVFVLVPQDNNPVQIFASDTEVTTLENYTIKVAAPGAEAVRVYLFPGEIFDGGEYEPEEPYWETDSQVLVCGDWSDCTSSYVYAASACFDGEWTDYRDCTVRVNIAAENGSLTGELITLSTLEIQPNESIDITVNQIENAERASKWLFGQNADSPEIPGDGFGTETVSGNDLTPGGIYTVGANAMAYGYEHTFQRAWFMVNYENASISDDHNSTLTIRTPGTEVETWIAQPFTLFAPGTDEVEYRLYRVLEDGLEDWGEGHEGAPGLYVPEGLVTRYVGPYLLQARAHYPDSDWTSFDDCQMEFNVVAPYGDLPYPDAEMPDKAYLGETVTLHFNETDNATIYSYWIHTDDSLDGITGEERNEPGDFQIDTNALPGSGVYWVEIDVNSPGYAEGHGVLHLAVLDGNDQELSRDGFYFSVSSTAVDTNQDVHFIYYMPGAEAVRLIYGSPDEWGEERGGPGISKWDSWDTDCVVPVYAASCFDGNWTEPELICSIIVGNPSITINGGEESFSIDFALFDEIETEGCWMWHDHWINSFNIDNYNGLLALYGCEPEMSIAWAEDSDVQDKAIDLSVYDGNSGADLWLQEYPDQPCTGKLILTVRWADQEINYPIYVNYRYPDSLPTSMNGPDEVHVYMHGNSPVSEWESCTVTFADGFSFGSRTMLYVHKDAADHMEFYNDWGSSTIYFNGYDPGTYFGQLEIRDGNIALSKDVIFIIHNEDGTAPDAIHPAFTDESAYECTYTRAAFEDGQFYYHDGWVRNYEIANWEVFAIQRHTHPVWTAEIIGDAHGAEIWTNTWDWEGLTATRGFDVGFNNEPTEPCTIRYKVTCTWDNDVIEGYCTLNYVTPDSLPGNPLDLPTEFHGLRAGEEFGYPVEVLGGYEFGDPDHVRVMIWADFADGHHWEWGDNGQRWQFFTPRDSGTFRGSSGLVFENIRLDQEILFFVEDENGGEQSAEPNLGELQETVTVPYAPIIEWNDFPDGYYIHSGVWSGSIGNYDELRELYGCEPEWQFDYDENCDADIVFEPMDEGRWANIDIHHQPSQPMEADYTVRVNWGPYSVEKTLHVVFQDMGIPQGLKLDAPDTLFLQPGQSKSYTVGYTPAEWEGYGEFRYLDIGAIDDAPGLTFSADSESKTVTITAVDPGVYEVWIDYGFGGGISTGAVLTNTPPMRVIVPDGDGTLFTLSATEIMTGDQVTAQVYARGAERIRLSKVNGNGDTVHTFEQEGYSGIDYDMGEWWPGVFTVTAEAFYADQDAWQQVGDPIELTVTTHGDMDFFASEMPALVWAGDESIVFRFDDCGNIVGGEHEDAPDGWYKVCINDTMQDGYVVNYDYDWNDAGEHVITPDMYLDGRTLEAGHVYWFGMGAWRPHYTPGGSIEIHTAVVDPGKVLRLPAGLTEIDEEAFAGTSAQAVFIPASVTSIGSRAFADSAIVYAEVPEGLDIGNAFEGCHGDVVIEVYGIK